MSTGKTRLYESTDWRSGERRTSDGWVKLEEGDHLEVMGNIIDWTGRVLDEAEADTVRSAAETE